MAETFDSPLSAVQHLQTLHSTGQREKALQFATEVTLSRNLRKNLELHSLLGQVFFLSEHYEKAAMECLAGLALEPECRPLLVNAILCFERADRPDMAAGLWERLLRESPGDSTAALNFSRTLNLLGDCEQADAVLRKALCLQTPGSTGAIAIMHELSWYEFRSGRFKLGMEYVTLGRQLQPWGSHAVQHLRPILPRGANLSGKTIAIWGEGGQGDEIMTSRYAQIIERRGGKAVWVTQSGLDTLLSRVPGIKSVIRPVDVPSLSYDFWAPGGDLPWLLDLEQSEVPVAPFFRAEAKHAERWSRRIPKSGKLRVGLRWHGSSQYEPHLRRHIPFRMFGDLLSVEGVEFYSLQRDEGSEEIGADLRIHDLASHLTDWEETAAAIANLDLVISTCTSVPHLAAAMGKPVWLLCPTQPYYAWAQPSENTFWYPSMRLFRQTRYFDWTGPIDAISERLKALSGA